MDDIEVSRLHELEAVIEHGLKTFAQVGAERSAESFTGWQGQYAKAKPDTHAKRDAGDDEAIDKDWAGRVANLISPAFHAPVLDYALVNLVKHARREWLDNLLARLEAAAELHADHARRIRALLK